MTLLDQIINDIHQLADEMIFYYSGLEINSLTVGDQCKLEKIYDDYFQQSFILWDSLDDTDKIMACIKSSVVKRSVEDFLTDEQKIAILIMS